MSLWLATGVWAGPRIVGRPAAVRAGQVVQLAWDAPAGADELEVLLLLDGGARESLRLTRCLPGSSGTWEWRVPDLPSPAARLVLRWGSGGREIEGEPGPSFAIVCHSPRLAPLARRHGELWVGDTAAPSIETNGISPGTRAAWPSGSTVPATLPPDRLLAAPRVPLTALRAEPAVKGSRASVSTRSTALLLVPLRE